MLRVAYESDDPRATLAAIIKPYAMTEELIKMVSARDAIVNVSAETFIYYATSFVHLFSDPGGIGPVVYDSHNHALPYAHFTVNDHGVPEVQSSWRMGPVRVAVRRVHTALGTMFPMQVDYFAASVPTDAIPIISMHVNMGPKGDATIVSIALVNRVLGHSDFALILGDRVPMLVQPSTGACSRLPALIHEL